MTRTDIHPDRASIVEWLREHGNHDFDQHGICRRRDAADAIERGEHLDKAHD